MKRRKPRIPKLRYCYCNKERSTTIVERSDNLKMWRIRCGECGKHTRWAISKRYVAFLWNAGAVTEPKPEAEETDGDE